jgi:hypothetical protein
VTSLTTRRFLESWAGVVKGGDASAHPYASQADFILKHGRAFEWRALPHGVRMGYWPMGRRTALRKLGNGDPVLPAAQHAQDVTPCQALTASATACAPVRRGKPISSLSMRP